MKINAPADFDIRHFRFVRQTAQPMIETHEPSSKLRWAFAVAVAVIALAALGVA